MHYMIFLNMWKLWNGSIELRYLYLNRYLYLSILHHLVDKLGCFHFLTIANNATLNLVCRYLFDILVLFSLDIYLRMKLMNRVIDQFLDSKGISILFFIMHKNFTFSWTQHNFFSFSCLFISTFKKDSFDNNHSY